MIEQSPELKDLAAALAKAQSQVKGAVKDSTNPHFKSKYADLASIVDACGDALSANGLSVVQFPGYEAREDQFIATLTTMLLHTSGQWVREIAGAPVSKADAQGVGSVITYLRRYSLAAIARVAPEDDDGNAAKTPARPANVDRDGVLRLPGDNTKWDGFGGEPLTDVPSDVLAKVSKWLDKKDPVKNKTLIGAIADVMELRRVGLDQTPSQFAETEDEKKFADRIGK